VSELFFDYELPESAIAQYPTSTRDESRLLVLHKVTGQIEHRHFRDLPMSLNAGDLIVRNDTKVLPARLVGIRERTGGKWESLFLRALPTGVWELLAKTRGYVEPGEICITANGLRLKLVGRTTEKHWLMMPETPAPVAELLAIHGQIPLPPYIRNGRASESDAERYQTVYAQAAGSIAAPTAGLHFTPELFATLDAKGISTATVTLHVGLGTFAPVKETDPTQHMIHAEWCSVPAETTEAIRATKATGGRVIAVGTTTTRTLESAITTGDTKLFIHPPYSFQTVDALITNFHLPRTTLLLLVQALSGSDNLRRAYTEAIAQNYRFFSYGDAMLVI